MKTKYVKIHRVIIKTMKLPQCPQPFQRFINNRIEQVFDYKSDRRTMTIIFKFCNKFRIVKSTQWVKIIICV